MFCFCQIVSVHIVYKIILKALVLFKRKTPGPGITMIVTRIFAYDNNAFDVHYQCLAQMKNMTHALHLASSNVTFENEMG